MQRVLKPQVITPLYNRWSLFLAVITMSAIALNTITSIALKLYKLILS